MKKIIIFGAAGGTGIEIVKQALEKGHRVTALVRNPAKLALVHDNLTIVQGDVTLAGSFDKAMIGQDAVISAIGNRSTKPTTLYSEGLGNIIQSMYQNNLQRLICISAGGLDVNPEANFFTRLLTRYVLQRILKEPYADLRMMEEIVKRSNMNYTIMRPSRLLDKPATGNYRIGVSSNIKNPFSIARADVAHFIVNHIDDKATFRSTVSMSY